MILIHNKTNYFLVIVFFAFCDSQEIDVSQFIPSNYDQNILPTVYNGIFTTQIYFLLKINF